MGYVVARLFMMNVAYVVVVVLVRTIIVQVNGKLRDQFTTNKNLKDEEIISLALNLEKIKKHLQSQEIKRKIYVKKKLVNFVI